MDRRRITIIFVSIFLILLLLVIILLLIFRPFGREEIDLPVANINSGGNEVIIAPIDQLPPPSDDRKEDEENYPLGLKQLAMSYAERFASYSSDASFKNLEDLKSLSTDNMKSSINAFIASSNVGDQGYEAVEARALNSQLIYFTADEAIITISLQLNKFKGNKTTSDTVYDELRLNCVKSGDEWIVDEVQWQ